MKYKFNFMQIANWIYICKEDLRKVMKLVSKENYKKEELIKQLESQKRNLLIVKDIIKKEKKLHGIQKTFLSNLQNIKNAHGIE